MRSRPYRACYVISYVFCVLGYHYYHRKIAFGTIRASTMSFPSTTIITARCLCRANDFSIAVPSSELPLEGSICHCDSCRHLTGCLFFAAAKWPYTLPQSPHLKSFSFSDSLNTYFCDICGTQMFSERVKANSGQQTGATETNIVYVNSGALEQTEGV